MSVFLKKVCIQNFTFLTHFPPQKRQSLHFVFFFKKQDFDLKDLQRVRFRFEKNTAR